MTGKSNQSTESPWYRNPIVLVALGLFAAILLGLALYVVADRSNGQRRFDAHLHVADDVNRGHHVPDHPGNHDDRSSGRAGSDDHPDQPADHR